MFIAEHITPTSAHISVNFSYILLTFINVTILLIYFFNLRLIPESVRWLLTKKRTKEASDIILKAARKNGVSLSERVMSEIRTSSEQKDAEVSLYITLRINSSHKTPLCDYRKAHN